MKKNIEMHRSATPEAMVVSIDDGTWEPPLAAFKGAPTSGPPRTADDRTKRGTVQASANRR